MSQNFKHYQLIDGADSLDTVIEKWKNGEWVNDFFYFHQGRISTTLIMNRAWESRIVVKIEDFANSIKTLRLLKHLEELPDNNEK